eukprot:2285263-Pleurochrysis_carterae.AAC.1
MLCQTPEARAGRGPNGGSSECSDERRSAAVCFVTTGEWGRAIVEWRGLGRVAVALSLRLGVKGNERRRRGRGAARQGVSCESASGNMVGRELAG